jgi:hypothetical protein
MAGFGLIHLGFLAAAAAVAVPILIHLLLRPRARAVDIGTLRFLRLVLKDSTRRRKLRRWLLLALRTLAVLLLALLFARPYFKAAGLEGRQREVVLLIDQSASMAVMQSGKTLFARAQEAAAQILKDLPEQTATHLAYFDAAAVAAAAEARIDRRREPGFGGTDYGQVLRWARDVIVNSNRPQRKVILFTDLQRSGLRGTTFEGFPRDVEVEVVEVGKALRANLAVETAEASEALIRPNEPVMVTANLLNAGPVPASNVQVRLSLEGPGGKLPDQVQTVSLAPAARQLVRFTPPIQKPGIYTGYVEVTSDDEFPLDNRRWLAVEARTPDRLLLVDGEPGETVYTNETYYLEAALRLRLPSRGAPLTPYEPERLALPEGTDLPDLAPFRLVALCNVARLSEGDLSRLRTFVAKGGSLLVFTGKHVQQEGYEALTRLELLPARVEGTAGPDLYRFDTWEKDHPVLRPLSDPQHGDLRRVTFSYLTRLKASPGAKVLAKAQTGDPLIVEGRLERGTILVFASTADRDWGDWPQTRFYVPLVHQMVGYLTERLPENQHVRQALAGPGRDNPPGIDRAEDVVRVHNLDPKESEIERATAKQFREAFHLPEPDAGDKKLLTAGAIKLPPGSERPDELWTYVVWVLLFVLVAEVFVANRTYA